MFWCILTLSTLVAIDKFKGCNMGPTPPLLICENKCEAKPLGNSKKILNMWFNLFVDILEYESLTKKFLNTLHSLSRTKEEDDLIFANIPKRKNNIVGAYV